MSDFSMGATLTLTDNFSSTLTAAGQTAENFKAKVTDISSSMAAGTTAVNGMTSATDSLTASLSEAESAADFSGASQDIESLASSMKGVDAMADDMSVSFAAVDSSMEDFLASATSLETEVTGTWKSTDQAAASTNKWKAAIQQFNAGAQDLKTIPGVIKQIAAQKLDGLHNSILTVQASVGVVLGYK